ncbi:MAG: hypothetical protein ACJAX4_001005 [Clostridium sp.]|jgi:hypothetical protein
MIVVPSLITGVFIICGSIILGRYILSISENNEIGTYQMIMVDEKYIVVLDTRTGQYWRKPIVDNSSIKTTDKYA